MTGPGGGRRRLLDRPDRVYPIVGLVLIAILVLGALALALVLGSAAEGF